MWDTPIGTRTLGTAENNLFTFAIDDFCRAKGQWGEEKGEGWADDTADFPEKGWVDDTADFPETGVEAFDRLTDNQKIGALFTIGLGFGDDNTPAVSRTQALDATVAAMLCLIAENVAFEVETWGARDEVVDRMSTVRWRKYILNAMTERKQAGLFKGEIVLVPTSTDVEAWKSLIHNVLGSGVADIAHMSQDLTEPSDPGDEEVAGMIGVLVLSNDLLEEGDS